jgi:diguanylate cyclase (GGDEF)-like protein
MARRPTRRSAKPQASGKDSLVSARRELRTLYAALDNVQSGILILDCDLRAVYSNPVLHRMFKAHNQEETRTKKLTYERMLRLADIASAVDLEDYVARRLRWVQSGDSTPMDLRMTDGTVLRCHLAVLPEGGRMLIYSDVTDIVRNAQELERLATTDGMTGIYNRRHFLALADIEWSRTCRYNRPLSFMIFDVDYFKSINDQFGHQAGDDVIVHLANVASSCKRAPDVLARIGGEEFALLLPETDLLQAQAMAERLRSEVASRPLTSASQSIPATVSIGIAERSPEITSMTQLMRAADGALYEAKRTGRNRIVSTLSERQTVQPDLPANNAQSLSEQGRPEVAH